MITEAPTRTPTKTEPAIRPGPDWDPDEEMRPDELCPDQITKVVRKITP